jgi:uncharacterized membrane protein YhaH (DUF805 family)
MALDIEEIINRYKRKKKDDNRKRDTSKGRSVKSEEMKHKQCPKCQYTRKPLDDKITPLTECPSCGIVYDKYHANIKPEKSNQTNSPIIKKNRHGFGWIIDTYLSFNVWKKRFFGFMFLVWFLCAVSVGMIAHSEWHSVHDVIAITLLIILQGFIFIGVPYKFIIFIEHIQENYSEESFIYKLLASMSTRNGRIHRLDYFINTLVLESLIFATIFATIFFIPIFIILISEILPITIYSIHIMKYIIIPIGLLFILMLLYFLGVITLKRITDIGKSRWLVLMFLVPGVNLLFQISLYFIPGTMSGMPAFKKKGYKECPECAELVLVKALKCRFCGYRF